MTTELPKVSTAPEDARWEVWDRDRLLRIVEKLPESCRVGISHGQSGGRSDCMYSIFRVWPDRSVHVAFWDLDDHPHAVCLTQTVDGEANKITWLSGGMRAWLDVLEISRDELVASADRVRLGHAVRIDIGRPIDETLSTPKHKQSSGRRRFSFGSPEWPGVAKLNEECGEAVQIIGKLMNFEEGGFEHWDGTNLRDEIMKEVADVQAAIAFVVKHCDLDARYIAARAGQKLALFEKWHVEQADNQTDKEI